MAKRGRSGCGKLLHSAGTIVLFAILFLVAGGFFFWHAVHSKYKGYPEKFRDVEVRHGQKTATIFRHLQDAGIVRDRWIPTIYTKIVHRNDSLKAGTYEFDRPMSAAEVVEKLVKGDVILRTVTVREGLDRFAVGRLFVAEGLGSEAEWDRATADAELVRDLDPQATTLEGYLFPDTYKFVPRTPVPTIVRAMVQGFRKHFGPEMGYISSGLDLHHTVVLASIVETEAKLPDERPLVASVYVNRANRGMLLGADPTVIYALKLAGRWNGNIHKADLSIDSPYNTYRVKGWPPGPIANPGLASLRAAAAPARTNFLYFVAKHDGGHAFSTTLEEHNRNVEIYQRQWYRDHRAATVTDTTGSVPAR